MSNTNGYDIRGVINTRTNEILAAHVGNLVIGQAQAQGAADVFDKELQQASTLVSELHAKNQELSGRVQELETDLANAEAQFNSKPEVTTDEAQAVIEAAGGLVSWPVRVE